MTRLVASTERIPGSAERGRQQIGTISYRYRGVIRDGRRVVWRCDHEHEFRDGHVYRWALVHGPAGAAATCAADELARAAREEVARRESDLTAG